MKKAFILLISLMLLFTGCSMDSAPTTGEIHVTINGGNSRSVTEGTSPKTDIEKITLVLTSNSTVNGEWINKNAEIDYTGDTVTRSFTVPGGYYSIKVYAYDSCGRQIASRMSNTISVSPGNKTECKFSFAEESSGISHNDLNVSVQTYDHVGESIRIKLSKMNSSSAETADTVVYTENRALDSVTSTIRLDYGPNYSNLSNGYYSVSFFALEENDNSKEVFLGSMPVRLSDGSSYVSAVWTGDYFTFTPNVYYYGSVDASQYDPLLFSLDVRGSRIADCELVYFNETGIKVVDTMTVSDLTSYGMQTVSLQNLNLNPGNYDMALRYHVEGDKDDYLYLLGNVTVASTKAISISGPSKIAKHVDVADSEYFSSYFYSCKYANGSDVDSSYYDLKWYIRQGSSDFVEIYSSRNGLLSIPAKSYTEDFTIKAELYFKDTDFLVKSSEEKTVTFVPNYIDSESIKVYPSKGKYYIENASSVAVSVHFSVNDYNISTVEIKSGTRGEFDFSSYSGQSVKYVINPIIGDEEKDGDEYKGEWVDGYFNISSGYSDWISINTPSNGTYFTSNDYPVITYDKSSGYSIEEVKVNYQTSISSQTETYICNTGLSDGFNTITVSYNIGAGSPVSRNFQIMYYSAGIPAIEVDQVYQAYVIGGNVQNDFQVGYKTLMLKEASENKPNTYYLFDISYSMASNSPLMSLGAGTYSVDGDEIKLEDVITVMPSGNPPAPVTGLFVKDDDGNIVSIEIDGVNYDLLNNQLEAPVNAENYEGAWQLKSIIPNNDVLNSVLGMLTTNMLPGVTNLLCFNEDEGIAIDLFAEIVGDTLRGFASVDADVTALDGTVSLSEVFVPFACLTAPIEIDEFGSPVVLGATAPLRIITTTDESVLIAYANINGMVIPVPFTRTSEYGGIQLNGNTNGQDMTVEYGALLDFAEKAITAYPAVESMIAPMFSTKFIDYDSIEMMGVWRAQSEDIEWLNDTDWFIANNRIKALNGDTYRGSIYLSNDGYDDYYCFSKFDDSGKYDSSGRLYITDLKGNADEVSLSMKICTDGLPYETGTVKLTKVNISFMDYILRLGMLLGDEENDLIKFTSEGKLIYCNEGASDIVVGNWCFGDNGDTIRLTLKPWLFAGEWECPEDLDIAIGIELSYEDDEIMILEFIDETGSKPFGIKLSTN